MIVGSESHPFRVRIPHDEINDRLIWVDTRETANGRIDILPMETVRGTRRKKLKRRCPSAA